MLRASGKNRSLFSIRKFQFYRSEQFKLFDNAVSVDSLLIA